MKYIKDINEINSNLSVNEGAKETALKFLSRAGKHATMAIIQYLNENPDLITDVFQGLEDSKNR